MRIFHAMRNHRIRHRFSREGRADMSYERASLQLRVLVALAAADHEILTSEFERLSEIADRIATRQTKDRVHALLHMLLQAPPTEEDALRALIAAPGHRGLTRGLVDDITAVARADSHVDVREERLVRLLSAVGGGTPLSLRHRTGVPLDHADRELVARITAEVAADRAGRAAA